MTGTGTAADPYVVSSWEELISMNGKANLYIEAEENAIWDFNEIYPTGVPAGLQLGNNTIFDGKGLIIKNIFINRAVPIYSAGYLLAHSGGLISIHNVTSRIKNTTFLKIDCRVGTIISVYDSESTTNEVFDKCRFSSLLIDGTAFLGAHANFGFSQCSFDIKLSGSAQFHYLTAETMPKFYHCRLKFDCSACTNTGTNSLVLNNSRIEGNISSGEWRIGDSSYYSFNSVIDAYFTYITDIRSFSKNIIVNTDKMLEGGSVADNLIGISKSQMIDAAYLSSEGFPIGVN